MEILRKKPSKRGETMIAIVIGIFLIAVIIVGIMSLLTKNYEIEDNYNRNNAIYILKNNASNLANKLKTDNGAEGDVFFMYKNIDAQKYQVLYGTGNETFKYINKNGELVVSTGSYTDGTIYTRIFYTEKKDFGNGTTKQIIKGSVKELIRK